MPKSVHWIVRVTTWLAAAHFWLISPLLLGTSGEWSDAARRYKFYLYEFITKASDGWANAAYRCGYAVSTWVLLAAAIMSCFKFAGSSQTLVSSSPIVVPPGILETQRGDN